MNTSKKISIGSIVAIVLGTLRFLSGIFVIVEMSSREMAIENISIGGIFRTSVVGLLTVYFGFRAYREGLKDYFNYLIAIYLIVLGYSFFSFNVGGEGGLIHLIITSAALGVFWMGRQAAIKKSSGLDPVEK